jgi:PIN domain nuclease of toxin-antitoxin system
VTVIDASALLAMIRGEAGAATVEAVLDGAAISAVNWSEVYHRAVEHGVDVAGLRADVEGLGVEIVPFSADDAERAAELVPVTRERGLSLADRACLALADRLGLPVVTADRSWLGLDLGVEIRAIR